MTSLEYEKVIILSSYEHKRMFYLYFILLLYVCIAEKCFPFSHTYSTCKTHNFIMRLYILSKQITENCMKKVLPFGRSIFIHILSTHTYTYVIHIRKASHIHFTVLDVIKFQEERSKINFSQGNTLHKE